MAWIQQHKLIFAVLVGVVVIGVWYGMTSEGTPASDSLVVVEDLSGLGGSPSENLVERDVVESLLTLRAITLQDKILNDPAFMLLQDFSTNIVPEPVGRANPFAPLEDRAAPAPDTTTQGAPATPRR